MKKNIFVSLSIVILLGLGTSRAHAQGTINCARSLTFEQAKTAINLGGSGNGIILGTRNPATGMLEISANGDAFVKNDTDCPISLSAVSYSLNDPSDPDFRLQTFYAASPVGTYVPAHSSATLHVNVPPCNFQADFFYGDTYSRSNTDRYSKSPYFLDAGYTVNRALSGGTPCPAPSPSPVPQPSPTPPPSYNPPPYYPPTYTPPPTYYPPYYPTQYPQPPQIVQTSMQIQPQLVQLPEYVPLTEIPYTGLDDYPLLPLYATMFVVWTGIVSLCLFKRMLKNRVVGTK